MKETLDFIEHSLSSEVDRLRALPQPVNGTWVARALVERAEKAVATFRSIRSAIPDKPLPPDNFWIPRAGRPPISDRMLSLYQLERPGKSLPPKHPAIILAPEDDSAVFVAIDRGKVAQVVFRNDSGFLSSELIRQAMGFTWRAFPDKPLFTLIDPATTRARVPGFVFRMAGWRTMGLTPSKLKLVANPRWFEKSDTLSELIAEAVTGAK